MTVLRSAYTFLKATAFHDIKLPAKVTLLSKRLRKAYGYYYNNPHTIEIDASITEPQKILQVMAHEMIHAALEQSAACDHHQHDANFTELRRIICERMGWKLKDV